MPEKKNDAGFEPVDLEVELVDEEAKEPEAKKAEAPPKDDEEALSKQDVSERVQRRIDRLTLRAKSAEEREGALLQRLRETENRLSEADKQAKSTVSTSLDVAEGAAKDKLKLAQQAFASAYDAGDKDALVEAQTQIAEATAEIKFISTQKVRAKAEPVEEVKKETQAAPKYDPKAVAWARSNNTWFGKDRVMTAAALAIDAQLKEEGFDPTSEEFYEEVDQRIRNEFPQRFQSEQEDEPKEERKAPPKAPLVSGKSRGPAGGKQTIRLSPNQVRIARVMGLTPQDYAKRLRDTEEKQTDAGYTLID